MEIQSLSVLCSLHQFFGARPVFVLCVLSQKFFFQFVDTVEVARSVKVGTFLHGCERSPALGIYDVGVFKRFFHAVCLGERTAGSRCVLLCDLLDLRHYVVSFRMSEYYIHTETCHKSDDALGNGEGFAVGGRVSPCHGQFLAFQVLHAAELMNDMQHVGHTLCGMVHVALQVYQSGSLLQDAVFVAFGYGVHKFFLICVSFADVHIVADTDHVSHERNHVGGFADSFPVSDLGFLFVQILYGQAQKVACGSERKTGTCGIITENGDAQSGLKYLGGDVVFSHESEGVGYSENSLQLVVCLIPGPEEIVVVHFFEIQFI